MASCRVCWAHLGWSFDGVDDGDSFLGLVLTNLRERRVDEAYLAAMANPAYGTTTRMEEMDQVMELLVSSGRASVEVDAVQGGEESVVGEVEEEGGATPPPPPPPPVE